MAQKVTIHTFKPGEMEELDAQLWDGERGIVKLLPAEFYEKIPHSSLRAWCVRRAVYQLPTTQLIDWLREKINGRRAIKVGSGNNGINHYLGIPGTDNRSQLLRHIATLYQIQRQTPTSPPPQVETFDAIEAIHKFQPEVVVAAWLTQRYIAGTSDDDYQYGPDEDEIIQYLDTPGKVYIHIGNAMIHGGKRILRHPHAELVPRGLVSRAERQAANVVYVWSGGNEGF